MPSTLISTRAGWIEDPFAVIDAVHAALCAVLKIPEGDRTLRLAEHAPSHFAVPPGKGARYTLVEITLFSGRSFEAKALLYRAIVANLGRLGVPPLDIKIVLIESPQENWGLRGGKPASTIDLGFTVEV